MIETAVFCLAMNVYFEARSEPIEGQIAVAQVTMNRVKNRKPSNDVCKVVTARKQFSWTIDKLRPVRVSGKFVGYQLKPEYHPKDLAAWNQAVVVAKLVMKDSVVKDLSNGALFYHTKQVKPWWKPKSDQVVASLGNHVFYRHDKSSVSYNKNVN